MDQDWRFIPGYAQDIEIVRRAFDKTFEGTAQKPEILADVGVDDFYDFYDWIDPRSIYSEGRFRWSDSWRFGVSQ